MDFEPTQGSTRFDYRVVLRGLNPTFVHNFRLYTNKYIKLISWRLESKFHNYTIFLISGIVNTRFNNQTPGRPKGKQKTTNNMDKINVSIDRRREGQHKYASTRRVSLSSKLTPLLKPPQGTMEREWRCSCGAIFLRLLVIGS